MYISGYSATNEAKMKVYIRINHWINMQKINLVAYFLSSSESCILDFRKNVPAHTRMCSCVPVVSGCSPAHTVPLHIRCSGKRACAAFGAETICSEQICPVYIEVHWIKINYCEKNFNVLRKNILPHRFRFSHL